MTVKTYPTKLFSQCWLNMLGSTLRSLLLVPAAATHTTCGSYWHLQVSPVTFHHFLKHAFPPKSLLILTVRVCKSCHLPEDDGGWLFLAGQPDWSARTVQSSILKSASEIQPGVCSGFV